MCSVARRSLSRFGCLAGWGSLAYLLARLLPGSRAPGSRFARSLPRACSRAASSNVSVCLGLSLCRRCSSLRIISISGVCRPCFFNNRLRHLCVFLTW